MKVMIVRSGVSESGEREIEREMPTSIIFHCILPIRRPCWTMYRTHRMTWSDQSPFSVRQTYSKLYISTTASVRICSCRGIRPLLGHIGLVGSTGMLICVQCLRTVSRYLLKWFAGEETDTSPSDWRRLEMAPDIPIFPKIMSHIHTWGSFFFFFFWLMNLFSLKPNLINLKNVFETSDYHYFILFFPCVPSDIWNSKYHRSSRYDGPRESCWNLMR